MALLNATLWNDLQSTDATNEKRFAELGIIDAVKASTLSVDYISPSIKAEMQKMSSDRNPQIPVLKDQTVTVNQTPGFNYIPSNLPESAQYSFTAVDVFSGFRHYPAQYANNTVDSDWARREVMKNVAYAMGGTIEGLLSTQLDARKTQVLSYTTQVSQGSGGGTFTFNTTPDVLEINKAGQQTPMFANLTALMEANELPGKYRVVTSRAGLAVQKTEALQYGADNSKNLQALGMFSADQMHESGNIAAGSDIFNGYLIRDGAIGIIENFPYDFRNGTSFAGKTWTISDQEIPFTGMRANIYTNTEATEATSLVTSGTDSNLKMTHFEEMAIWQRFFIVYRYNNDITTRVNDIVKLSGKTS